MYKMRGLYIFVVWGFLFSASVSAEPTLQSAFQEGIAHYQAGEYEAARSSFEAAYRLNPESPAILTNLGLAYYKNGQVGLAIGLWRRALNIKPAHKEAQHAIAYAWKHLKVQEIPHQVDPWEKFRSWILVPISFYTWLAVSAFLLLFVGWSLLFYLGSRREALKEELRLPPFPVVTFVLCGLTVVSLIITSLKVWDYSISRAVIVPAKLEVRAGPADTQPVLFELYEGFEVVVSETQTGWARVTYPGALSGWVPQKDIFTTTGGALW